MQQRGSKRINIERFTVKKADSTTNLPIHSNALTLFFKQNKSDKWYRKQYADHSNASPYEREAAAGDLYRFILGKERAAKAQVTYNQEKTIKNGVISQHNPAGFTSFDNISRMQSSEEKNNGDSMSTALSVENGRCEVMMAESILDEIDGIANADNVGLNSKNEISRIDYDCSFYHSKPRAEIKENFIWNESLVNATNNEKVIKRFYKSQIKIAIINEQVLATILNRHFLDSVAEKEMLDLILPSTLVVHQQLLQSEEFKNFMRNFDYDELRAEFKDFFKHENKKSILEFNACIMSLEKSYNQIKETCLSNNTSLRR